MNVVITFIPATQQFQRVLTSTVVILAFAMRVTNVGEATAMVRSYNFVLYLEI